MLINLSDIDLKLLRVFVAVAEARGVSAAQETLLMNQSTISTHGLAGNPAGFRLCQRGRSGFRLTPKGERMLIACRSLFNAARDFTRVSQSLNGLLTGDLQIGLVDNLVSLPGNPFSRAIKHFQRRHQDVQLQCRICSPNEIEQGLLHRQLDLGIGYFGQQLRRCVISHGWRRRRRSTAVRITRCSRWKNRIASRLKTRAGSSAATAGAAAVPDRAASPAAVAHHMESVAHLVLSGSCLGYLPTHYAARWVEQGLLRQLGGAALLPRHAQPRSAALSSPTRR